MDVASVNAAAAYFPDARCLNKKCRQQDQKDDNRNNVPDDELDKTVPAIFVDLDQFGIIVASLHRFLPDLLQVWRNPLRETPKIS